MTTGSYIWFKNEVGYVRAGEVYIIEFIGKRTFSIRNVKRGSATDLPLWALKLATECGG